MRVVRFIPGFIEQNKEEQAKYRWQTFGILLALFAVAAIANLPHARAVKTLAYQAGETDALALCLFGWVYGYLLELIWVRL